MNMNKNNYARFYALFAKLCRQGRISDRETYKSTVVLQYTWNRTEHVSEMTPAEYKAACEGMARIVGESGEELRFQRSAVLHLLQKMGIDTTDWERVNSFLSDPRISGKSFYEHDEEELKELQSKLRIILRKGGLKQKQEKQPKLVVFGFPFFGRKTKKD